MSITNPYSTNSVIKFRLMPEYEEELRQKALSFSSEQVLTSRMQSIRKEINYIEQNLDSLDFQTQQSLPELKKEIMKVGLELANLFELQLKKKWAK